MKLTPKNATGVITSYSIHYTKLYELEVIVHETIRCRSIIKELLEFSRDKEPKKSLSNINQIIRQVFFILNCITVTCMQRA